MVLVKLRELKSRRGEEEEGPGTGVGVSRIWGMRKQIHTSHGGDAIGRLGVLEVGLEVGERVVREGGVHEGGAAWVLEESGFHGDVRMQR